FITAARALAKPERRVANENALLSAALEESVARLKAQERATKARAEASERLSSEIISSLTAGLMVVGLKGEVRIINPAGRRLLSVPEDASPGHFRRLIGEPALSTVIDECLSTSQAVVRRTVHMPDRRQGAARYRGAVYPRVLPHKE